MCACKTEIETTEHYLLRCQFYSTQRLEYFEKLEKFEPNFLSLSANNQVPILLYGSPTNSENLNQEIVLFYLKSTTRFDRPLTDCYFCFCFFLFCFCFFPKCFFFVNWIFIYT